MYRCPRARPRPPEQQRPDRARGCWRTRRQKTRQRCGLPMQLLRWSCVSSTRICPGRGINWGRRMGCAPRLLLRRHVASYRRCCAAATGGVSHSRGRSVKCLVEPGRADRGCTEIIALQAVDPERGEVGRVLGFLDAFGDGYHVELLTDAKERGGQHLIVGIPGDAANELTINLEDVEVEIL